MQTDLKKVAGGISAQEFPKKKRKLSKSARRQVGRYYNKICM